MVAVADVLALIEARIVEARLMLDQARYPHVVVHMSTPLASSFDLGASHSVQRIDWQTTVVGLSRAQVVAALDRLEPAMRRWRPLGEPHGFVVHESGQPVRRDDTLPDREVWYATDQWSLTA